MNENTCTNCSENLKGKGRKQRTSGLQHLYPSWRNHWPVSCMAHCHGSTNGQSQKPNGFTILEMMVVLLVVAVLLMITLPNIQQKEKVIRGKGCDALLEVVNSQIMLYEIENDETPTSVSELVSQGYLKESQTACPNGETVQIVNGEASR